MVVYKCFMGVSGQAVTDRVKRLMSPSTPKIEAEVADGIERWVESGRTLETLKIGIQTPGRIQDHCAGAVMDLSLHRHNFLGWPYLVKVMTSEMKRIRLMMANPVCSSVMSTDVMSMPAMV